MAKAVFKKAKKKARVNMTKPVFLGFPILDFVKLRCTFLIQSYGTKT